MNSLLLHYLHFDLCLLLLNGKEYGVGVILPRQRPVPALPSLRCASPSWCNTELINYTFYYIHFQEFILDGDLFLSLSLSLSLSLVGILYYLISLCVYILSL